MFESFLELSKVIAIILLIGVLLAVGALAGVIGADAIFGPKASDHSNITYPNPTGEGDLYAYLNIPQAEGPYPGVLMLPYQWGLNSQITRLANFLSERGYIVLVPDLYRGSASDSTPRAVLLTQITPDEQLFNDIQAGYDHLQTLRQIDPDKIAVVGFGYGGRVALRYAAQQPQLAATVNISGQVLTTADSLANIGAGPVLGLFGEADTATPPDQLTAFGVALETAGIDYEIKTYPRAASEFVKLPDLTVFNSAAYNAWNDMIGFLDATLKA